jgi:threonine aldolase
VPVRSVAKFARGAQFRAIQKTASELLDLLQATYVFTGTHANRLCVGRSDAFSVTAGQASVSYSRRSCLNDK